MFYYLEVEAARNVLINKHMYFDNLSNWVCIDCLYVSKNKHNCMEHIESRHMVFEDDYVCTVCQICVKTRKALRRHYERCHPKC